MKYIKYYDSLVQYLNDAEIPEDKSVIGLGSDLKTGEVALFDDQRKKPLTFNIISAGTIVWKAYNTAYTTTIEYSTDNGENWTGITSTTGGTNISVSAGDKVQFRGDNATYSSGSSRYNMFSGSTAKFSVEGNIMSLIDSTGFSTTTTLASSYTFYYLFSNCTGLTSAENLVLPATTLDNNCYRGMFYNCTSLTTAPALPATTLANGCYGSMFSYCTTLTTAPELPATTLAEYCYNEMFAYCLSLTTGPSSIGTSTRSMASSACTNMFAGCISLTTAPELPATTLAQYCYSYMFEGCTSLTTAPDLPAAILARGCYDSMFEGCTNLNYIKCLAIDKSASNCTKDWVDGVASTGTFVKSAFISSWTTGNNGIPANWTVEGGERNIMLWVDDFITEDMTKEERAEDCGYGSWDDYIEDYLDGIQQSNLWAFGANPYVYTWEQLELSGNTYYLWEYIKMQGNDYYGYLLTTTIDYNTLYSHSLAADCDNEWCPYVAMLDQDKNVQYTPADNRNDWLVDVLPPENS